MNEQYLQLGALAIIFIFFLKEFFTYLKNKNGGNKIGIQMALMNLKLDNHITHISEAIIQINANLKTNTEDTNEIKTDIAILKEKIK